MILNFDILIVTVLNISCYIAEFIVSHFLAILCRLLKGATQDSHYKRRYELMFVALVSVAGEALYQEFMKQEEIVKALQTTAEKVQQAKGSEKEVMCCVEERNLR